MKHEMREVRERMALRENRSWHRIVFVLCAVCVCAGCVGLQLPSPTRITLRDGSGAVCVHGMRDAVLWRNKSICRGYLLDEHKMRCCLWGLGSPMPSRTVLFVDLGPVKEEEGVVHLWLQRNALPTEGRTGQNWYELLEYMGPGTVVARCRNGLDLKGHVECVSTNSPKLDFECIIRGRRVSSSEFGEYYRRLPLHGKRE